MHPGYVLERFFCCNVYKVWVYKYMSGKPSSYVEVPAVIDFGCLSFFVRLSLSFYTRTIQNLWKEGHRHMTISSKEKIDVPTLNWIIRGLIIGYSFTRLCYNSRQLISGHLVVFNYLQTSMFPRSAW